MYVDPKRNQQAGNLAWILPYCKPDLPRVAGAVVLFCVNNTMALIIPLLSGLIVDRVITQGHVDELTRLCVMISCSPWCVSAPVTAAKCGWNASDRTPSIVSSATNSKNSTNLTSPTSTTLALATS